MKTSTLLLLAMAACAAGRASESAPDMPPNSLDLKAAIVYALDHNYGILQAREQIRQQEGLILQARARAIPNLSATGSYQRNDSTLELSYPPENTEWLGALEVTQTLFAGGGVTSSIRGAKLAREAALYDLQTAVDTQILGVRTAFYNVLLTREKVRVQEENVELFKNQLRDTNNQFAAGSVSNFEVLRAKVSLANAQPDLITARNDYRIALEQLREALGAPAGYAPEVVGTLDCKVGSWDLESSLASARERRPELLRLQKLEDSGEQSVVNARSNYYPNVNAFGEWEWGGEHLVEGGSYNSNGWLFGVQSSWAIFDGRATAGRVVQAKSQLRQAKLSREQEELAIDVEVHQAVSSVQEAAELVEATQQTVSQAEEALRLANSRFKAGTATQLDVQTSQVELTQARTNALQANYNYLVAEANLRKASGFSDALVER